MEVSRFRVLGLILLFGLLGCSAVDPDPLQDICIADLNATIHMNGFICKERSGVTSKDFVFTEFRTPGDISKMGFAANLASVYQFPALNSQGAAMVRADFGPRGANPPHYHPRATELVFVLEGSVYAGFITTDNRAYAEVLQKGDLFLVPKGLVHFQVNAGKGQAAVLGAFNSQNPGYQRVPTTTLFGTDNIQDQVLLRAFNLSQRALHSLRAKHKRYSTS